MSVAGGRVANGLEDGFENGHVGNSPDFKCPVADRTIYDFGSI